MVLVCLLTVFFFSLFPFSLFSLCCVGLGMTWGFSKNRFAIVCEMPRLWFKGFGKGQQSIQCIAIFYYMCVIGEVVEGGEGGNTIAKLPKYD